MGTLFQKTVGRLRPLQILPLGFLLIILIGAILLSLPISSSISDASIPFMDALFTATSATCVTGLTVIDVANQLSLFGQIIVIVLVQVGGLGFMTFATLFILMLGRKISLRNRMTLAEAQGMDSLQGVLKLGVRAAMLTFAIELIGAILLSIRFIPAFGVGKGIWYGIFHSISAFCNAGFDLMGNYDSLVSFAHDPLINITIMLLIVCGGLGFTVLSDIGQKKQFRQFRLHTKLTLLVSGALILLGAVLFFVLEFDNSATMGLFNIGDKILASFFQSVTTRTAGFNTISQSALTDTSKLVSTLLMAIGASPAGTGGGMKVTTIALILLSVRNTIKGKSDINLFHRRIPLSLVQRALSIFILFISTLLLSFAIVGFVENHTAVGALGLTNQAFEITSALATVGLSVGVTGTGGLVTHIILMLCMFIGRLGPLTLTLALAKPQDSNAQIRFPEENIMVG